MAALILDGKALAKTTEEELSARVAKLKEKTQNPGAQREPERARHPLAAPGSAPHR